MATAERPYDIVQLGLGLYGSIILQKLVEKGPQYRVAVASPFPEQLSARLAALGLAGRVGVIGPVDASHLAAMRELAAQTRVILACLPDYRTVGDAAVRACAEAGTHYFDLSGETDLHREWRARYGATAAANRCLVLSSCGFDSVVTDFGAMMLARRFAPPAKLHAIDCYMVVRPGPEGVTMRVSMFMERLGKPAARAAQASAAPPPLPSAGLPLLERLRRRLPLQYSRALRVLSAPGPQADVDVCTLSRNQGAWGPCGQQDPPPQLASRWALGTLGEERCRVVVPISVGSLLVVGLGMLMLHAAALARLPPFRWALTQVVAPALVRLGVLTRDEQRYLQVMRGMRITKVFVGRGTAASGAVVEEDLTVAGPEVAVTQSSLALAALTVLQERDRVRASGFSTPAAAFRDTSYWARLAAWSNITVTEGADFAAADEDRAKQE